MWAVIASASAVRLTKLASTSKEAATPIVTIQASAFWQSPWISSSAPCVLIRRVLVQSSEPIWKPAYVSVQHPRGFGGPEGGGGTKSGA